jgi:hypothetical protein
VTRAIGIIALAVLVALGAIIATAGLDAVPAARRGGNPDWIGGIFGGGLGIDGGAYIWLERAALIAYVAVLICAAAIPRRMVWAAIVALVALFALAPPLLSLDVFSYVSYARLDGVHDLNPYEDAPARAPDDPSLAFVGEDWHNSVSVYGPLFTLLTLPVGSVGLAASVWLLKGIAAAAVLAVAAIVARVAVLRGGDPKAAAAFVALNPLVLVHVVGGAHNDALMAAVTIAAVAAILTARLLAGGIGVAAAAAVKASAILIAPFALVGHAPRRGRLIAGLALGAGAAVAAGLAAFGPSIDEAAKVVGQSQSVATQQSVPGTLSRKLDIDIDLLRGTLRVLWACGLAGLLVWTARGADWIRAAGWGALGLLVATTYLAPWYVIWVLPTVAVARDRLLTGAAIALTAFLLGEQVPDLGG